MKYRYSIAIGASLLMFVVYFVTNKNVPATAQTAASDSPSFVVPESFSSSEQLGKIAFSAKCQSCHGENALGNAELAPPLIHKIYEPNHHSDEAFHVAVLLGVRQHHWRFGNMPPVEGLTKGDVKNIIAYVRALQAANGIF